MRPVDDFQACHAWLRKMFRATTAERNDHPGLGWIEYERVELACAANQWAQSHGIDRRITRDDVEAVEGQAIGHVDYASKLCLYVAELVYDRRPGRYPERSDA